ncbi:hypothetical protein I5J35_gp56 [Mycobacterium phage Rem711]|uniref:Uncharacterized protein n=1 Tax=Mycobacterium phage Rem711 TaxID=2079285 RepID=A0A2K9VF10_9CAUD|nr:hypothetical protein I5J35_gp56 [Mycobacterium phage Rem711]AUV60834.1 hypothetical protein SEA_REM711_56 [Mycobacterium phage Rem711]
MTEIDPNGRSLTLGDLRRLISDADAAGHPDSCLIDLRTPLAGNRRAVRIAVIENAAGQQDSGNQAARSC